MLTTRFSWQGEKNRLIAARETVKEFIDFSESNPTAIGLDGSAEILREIFSGAEFFRQISRYQPHAQGMLSAREAICSYYCEQGITMFPEDLFLTSSTSEAYSYLFKLLSDPGDRIGVVRPGYPLFDMLAQLEGLHLGELPLARYGNKGFCFDSSAWPREIEGERDLRALLVVNPNNPTGNSLSVSEVQNLRRFCQVSIPGSELIVDEVFIDYIHEPWRQSAALGRIELSQGNAFFLNGFSKMVGLPQLKLSWIALTGDETWKNKVREPLSFIADTYLSASMPAMAAVPELLQHRWELQDPLQERIAQNLSFLNKLTFNNHDLELVETHGGWNVIVILHTIKQGQQECDEEGFSIWLLREKKIFLMPGYFFDIGIDASFVVSLLPDPALFQRGWAEIVAALESFGRL